MLLLLLIVMAMTNLFLIQVMEKSRALLHKNRFFSLCMSLTMHRPTCRRSVVNTASAVFKMKCARNTLEILLAPSSTTVADETYVRTDLGVNVLSVLCS